MTKKRLFVTSIMSAVLMAAPGFAQVRQQTPGLTDPAPMTTEPVERNDVDHDYGWLGLLGLAGLIGLRRRHRTDRVADDRRV